MHDADGVIAHNGVARNGRARGVCRLAQGPLDVPARRCLVQVHKLIAFRWIHAHANVNFTLDIAKKRTAFAATGFGRCTLALC